MKTTYMSNVVTVDGVKYNVGVISIEREAPILDKYAERTEDGGLHREPIGTYFNYKVKFTNSIGDPDDYDRLFWVLSEPVEYRTISVPFGKIGTHTYQAYVSGVKDSVQMIRGETTYWHNLSASFIATRPART